MTLKISLKYLEMILCISKIFKKDLKSIHVSWKCIPNLTHPHKDYTAYHHKYSFSLFYSTHYACKKGTLIILPNLRQMKQNRFH